MSAEYILSEGNHSVILCERGITTFEDSTRNTTDINAIPVLKHWTHLPVMLESKPLDRRLAVCGAGRSSRHRVRRGRVDGGGARRPAESS